MGRSNIRLVIVVLILLMVLALVGAAALIAWRSYRSMYGMLLGHVPPSAQLSQSAASGIAGLQSLSISTPEGLQLAAWYIPPAEGAGSIILAHGTGNDRASLLAEVQLLSAAGFGVLAFDWPGLGQSSGDIRWDGQARSALTATVDWLSVQPGVDPQRIGGLGFSIGGYVMAQVAAQDARLRAVVLESPSPDFNLYVHLHSSRWGALSEWAGRWALRNSGLLDPAVQPLQVIARIAPRPLLLVGGTQDANVPPAMVRQLYDAAREPKEVWIVQGASHGDYSAVAPEYASRLTGFFANHLQK